MGKPLSSFSHLGITPPTPLPLSTPLPFFLPLILSLLLYHHRLLIINPPPPISPQYHMVLRWAIRGFMWCMGMPRFYPKPAWPIFDPDEKATLIYYVGPI